MTIKNLLTKKSAVITGAVAAAAAVIIAAVFIFRGCNDNNEIKASGNTAQEEVSAVDKDNSAAADDKGLGNETAGTDKEKLENNDAAAVADTEVSSETTVIAASSEGTANEGNRNGEQGGNSDSSYVSGNSGENSSSNGNQDTWQGGDSVAPGNENQNGEQNGDTVQGGGEDTAQGGEDDAPQEMPDFPYECYVLTERLLCNIYGEPMYYVMGFYVPVDERGSERAGLMASRLFERSEELYGKVINCVGTRPVNEQGTPSGFTDYKTGRYYFVYDDHTFDGFEYKGY